MSTCVNKFTVHSREEQADLLAQKLPNGDVWTAKYIEDTNFRNVLIAVGLELSRTEQAENELYCETQLETTDKLIDEFEQEFGIKGGCLDGFGTTIEERIEAIKLKISLNGTTTNEQFVAIAAILGLDITIIAGWDKATFPFTFPYYFFENLKWARFTMVVDMDGILVGGFPYTFPFTFAESATAVMKCLFSKLKPANVRIIYINES
ncbi:MAG: hypothetical protein DRH97_00125 [Chloroflexi bacterium]|nr:MAG: hypothetical protein DRH97_00125 [Chloroflexota bacterium]